MDSPKSPVVKRFFIYIKYLSVTGLSNPYLARITPCAFSGICPTLAAIGSPGAPAIKENVAVIIRNKVIQ